MTTCLLTPAQAETVAKRSLAAAADCLARDARLHAEIGRVETFGVIDATTPGQNTNVSDAYGLVATAFDNLATTLRT